MSRYLFCLYWVVQTVVTVGYGDVSLQTSTERLFGIALMISGVIFFSFTVNNISSILLKIDKSKEQYENDLAILNKLQSDYALDDFLYDKIKVALKNNAKTKSKYIKELVENLPKNLQDDFYAKIYKNKIDKIGLFNKKDPNGDDEDTLLLDDKGIAYFSSLFTFETYEPGEFVYKPEYVSNKVFFIVKGKAEMREPNNFFAFEIHQGDTFGDMEFFENLTRLVAVYNPGDNIEEEIRHDLNHEENLKRLQTQREEARASLHIKGIRVASQENPIFHNTISEQNQSLLEVAVVTRSNYKKFFVDTYPNFGKLLEKRSKKKLEEFKHLISENMQRLRGIDNLKFGTTNIYRDIWCQIYEKNFARIKTVKKLGRKSLNTLKGSVVESILLGENLLKKDSESSNNLTSKTSFAESALSGHDKLLFNQDQKEIEGEEVNKLYDRLDNLEGEFSELKELINLYIDQSNNKR